MVQHTELRMVLITAQITLRTIIPTQMPLLQIHINLLKDATDITTTDIQVSPPFLDQTVQ